jgi:hypothetical protein
VSGVRRGRARELRRLRTPANFRRLCADDGRMAPKLDRGRRSRHRERGAADGVAAVGIGSRRVGAEDGSPCRHSRDRRVVCPRGRGWRPPRTPPRSSSFLP